LQDAHTNQFHLSESSTLTLDKVDRSHAGIFSCMADNGVRDPVYADIELTVLCKFHSERMEKAKRFFANSLPFFHSLTHFALLAVLNIKKYKRKCTFYAFVISIQMRKQQESSNSNRELKIQTGKNHKNVRRKANMTFYIFSLYGISQNIKVESKQHTIAESQKSL